MTDVRLYQTADGGEIDIVNGVTEMDDGLGTAAYLSLFGGNANGPQYWGNLLEDDPSNMYISETQRVIDGAPLTPSVLLSIEAAASRDLAAFLSTSTASDVSVTASIPARNVLSLDVQITAEGEQKNFNFVENWGSMT